MPTTSDLLNSSKRWLQSSGRPEYNKLTALITASATTATMDHALGSIAPGAIIGIDLEELYVWSVAGQVVTVQRGWNGSTGAIHALGSLVEVNPLFSNWRIFSEINAELSSLSSPAMGLYRIKTAPPITATTAGSYNLAADVMEILSVQYNDYGGSRDWPLLRRWDLLTNQDSTVFASGVALRLFEMPPPGRTIRVTYAAPFTALATLADDVTTISGLPASAADIPAIGAAARLLASRESRRSQIDAQPEPRQAADVPPGTARSASSQLFALRDRRIKEESAKLSAQYPSHIKRAAV